MSVFLDDIRNLCAVLDSLHSDECAIQQPLLRLIIDHLRLLAFQMDQELSAQFQIFSQTPPETPVSPVRNISVRLCLTMETRYAQ